MSERNAPSAVLATGLILAIAGGTTFGLYQAGLTPWSPEEAAAQTEQEAQGIVAQTVAVSSVNAQGFIDGLMTNLEGNWASSGRVPFAQPPYPLGCGQTQQGFVASESMTINDGADFQVTASVYHAGQGGKEFADQTKRVRTCGAGASSWKESDLGVESRMASATWDGAQSRTISWRRGDVILHVTAGPAEYDRLKDMARSVNDLATAALGPSCVNEGSVFDDYRRSPILAGADYAPFHQDKTVSIPDIVLPARADGSEPVFPLPEITVVDLKVPTVPTYPVAPALPAEVPRPDVPVAPERPATSTVVSIPMDDSRGPGCGWEFAGESKPGFDAAAAATVERDLTATAVSSMNTNAEAWKTAVQDYWVKYDAAALAATTFNTYASEVEVVKEAWAVIGSQWDDYNRQMDQFRLDQQAYDAAVLAKTDAQTRYDDLLQQCVAQDEADRVKEQERLDKEAEEAAAAANPTPTPSPSGTATPSPSPTPTEEPVEPEAPRVECPPIMPGELQTELPEVPVEPTPPPAP